jgi:hypothetical protein
MFYSEKTRTAPFKTRTAPFKTRTAPFKHAPRLLNTHRAF